MQCWTVFVTSMKLFTFFLLLVVFSFLQYSESSSGDLSSYNRQSVIHRLTDCILYELRSPELLSEYCRKEKTTNNKKKSKQFHRRNKNSNQD